MDVQTVAPTLESATLALPPRPASVGNDPPISPPGPSDAPVAATGLEAPISATAGLALLPPPHSSSGEGSSPSLSANVANVYDVSDQSVQVSFQPAPDSHEIVTVVTDKKTGKVIVQFPSETLIALAQFFQKIDSAPADGGAVVDKKV